MKKLALYFGILLLSVNIGCKQDSTETPQYSVEGTWQPYKIVETTITNGVSDSQIYNFSACQLESRWVLNADNTGNQTTKDEVAGNCDVVLNDNITYTYDKINNAMVITHQNGDVEYGRVISQTETQMNMVLETNTGTVYHSLTYSFNKK
ncbi:MAG: lipocalin family protein [Bacteroidetes bacterium]|nr:lipocalin family protein [Bacteroidota bacterium]